MWEEPGKVSDDELVWVHEPHYRVSGKYVRGNLGEALCLPPNTPQEYDLIYDQHGFRNEADLVTADIAVVGDSYVEAPMTPTPFLMTSVLGVLENATVANLGLSGYGPQQELATLKRYALPLNPKTIVWLFYEGNDLPNVYGYERDIAALTNDTRFMPWMRSFSRNAVLALGRIQRGCVPEDRLAKRYAIVRQPDGSQARVHFAIDGATLSEKDLTLSERDLKALGRTGSMLEEAYRLCRERGIRFVVVFVPERHRVYDGLPTVVEVSDEVKQWVVNDLPERLRATVADISPDISYVDLTTIFRTEVEKDAVVFLPDDTHWTVEGHRIAARAVHDLGVKSPIFVVKQHGDQLTEQVALMVRGPDGTIRYWSKGAERLYGWTREESLGDSSHRLLKTSFPKPLRSIEAELLKTGHWKGTLVHQRRDGSQVTVASRWEVQRYGKDRSTTAVEINGEPVVEQPKDQFTEDMALIVRGPDGTIRYWNKGAEYLYGWAPRETLGDSSHRLLKTIFPKPLQSIEAELLKAGHWEGTLVHQRRDGSQVTVASRWELQLSSKDQSATIVEINRDRQRDG